jgi:hypothetical protein
VRESGGENIAHNYKVNRIKKQLKKWLSPSMPRSKPNRENERTKWSPLI